MSLTVNLWPVKITGRDNVLKAVLNQETGVVEPVGTTDSPLAINVMDCAWR